MYVNKRYRSKTNVTGQKSRDPSTKNNNGMKYPIQGKTKIITFSESKIRGITKNC